MVRGTGSLERASSYSRLVSRNDVRCIPIAHLFGGPTCTRTTSAASFGVRLHDGLSPLGRPVLSRVGGCHTIPNAKLDANRPNYNSSLRTTRILSS